MIYQPESHQRISIIYQLLASSRTHVENDGIHRLRYYHCALDRRLCFVGKEPNKTQKRLYISVAVLNPDPATVTRSRYLFLHSFLKCSNVFCCHTCGTSYLQTVSLLRTEDNIIFLQNSTRSHSSSVTFLSM